MTNGSDKTKPPIPSDIVCHKAGRQVNMDALPANTSEVAAWERPIAHCPSLLLSRCYYKRETLWRKKRVFVAENRGDNCRPIAT